MYYFWLYWACFSKSVSFIFLKLFLKAFGCFMKQKCIVNDFNMALKTELVQKLIEANIY